jgi:hypothetical protein
MRPTLLKEKFSAAIPVVDPETWNSDSVIDFASSESSADWACDAADVNEGGAEEIAYGCVAEPDASSPDLDLFA